MLFHSVVFFLFLAAVLAARRVLPWSLARWALVAASYVFYGTARPWYCLLLLASTLVDFVAAQRIAAHADDRRRRAWLALSLTVNLGLLATFKYADFAIGNLNALVAGALSLLPLGERVVADVLPQFGWHESGPWAPLEIALPVGISFYTFQTLSYTIDVYRRDAEPTRDFAAFALYVAYFPQLVAGPIERARRLLPQLAERRPVSRRDFELGAQRILWGLVKKLVVADRLGIMVADVYADPGAASAPTLVVATLCFSFQLYLDFSAYTDIALGVARMMGVRLVENFRWPFLAHNPSDFWKRWHISLTQWFRDYVYASMGATSRSRTGATMLRMVAVMTLVGLWHGASWTFVLFGFISGCALALYALVRLAVRPRVGLFGGWWWSRPLAICSTFLFVNGTMIFFVSPTLETVGAVYAGIFTGPWTWSGAWNLQLAMVAGLVVVHLVRGVWMEARREVALPAPVRGAFWAAMVLALVYGAVQTAQPFIYFEF